MNDDLKAFLERQIAQLHAEIRELHKVNSQRIAELHAEIRELYKQHSQLYEEYLFYRGKTYDSYYTFKGIADFSVTGTVLFTVIALAIWLIRTYLHASTLSEKLGLIGISIPIGGVIIGLCKFYRKLWKPPDQSYLDYLRKKREEEEIRKNSKSI